MKQRLPLLKIDPDFKELIPRLNKEEYDKLEKSIIEEGCIEAICVWREYIIDGHNRYEICHKHDIIFEVKTVTLNSKEDAISWICSNVLRTRELPENVRRYLIGKRYGAERTVGVMNITGTNQYTIESMERKAHEGKTATKIGNEYHVSPSTVNKYLQYAKAVDKLRVAYPEYIDRMLNENIKVSQDNLIELAKMPDKNIRRILLRAGVKERIESADMDSSLKAKRKPLPSAARSTVKDMPAFDPDVYVASLTLTIPSWINNIKRAAANSDVSKLSKKAKYDLLLALDNLIYISTLTKKILEEE